MLKKIRKRYEYVGEQIVRLCYWDKFLVLFQVSIIENYISEQIGRVNRNGKLFMKKYGY